MDEPSFRASARPRQQVSHSSSSASTPASSSAEEYISAQSSIHSSSSSSEGSEQDYGRVVASALEAGDRTLQQQPVFEWPRFHDVMAQEASPRSFPSSTTRSTPSTESPHELDDDAAAESPFFAPPPPSAPMRSAVPHSQDPQPPLAPPQPRARPLPLILADSVNLPARRVGPAQKDTPSTASTTTTHVRISSSRASSRVAGFPYASSILTTSTSCADLRGSASRVKRSSQGSKKEGSMQSHRTSSDVDLDLSFDWQHEDPEAGMQAQQEQQRWVGIDMGRRDEDEEGPLGRGKRRVQSAVDIRAAYLAGEKAAAEAAARNDLGAGGAAGQQTFAGVAILMDNSHSSTYASPSPDMRASWARKAGGDVLPLTNPPSNLLARKNIPAPLSIDPSSSSTKRLSDSSRRGYAFNPTDPIEIPLPESPDAQAPQLKSEFEYSGGKAFPRPLKIIERTKQLSLSSAPSWVPFARGPTAAEMGKSRERGGGGQEEDIETVSPRPSGTWAEATREYLKSKGGKQQQQQRAGAVTSEGALTSPETSPIFSEGDFSSNRTAPTTPNDTPRLSDFEGADDEDEDEPVQATLSRSVKDRFSKGRLHGLGLDMRGSSDNLPSMSQKPLPPRPQPAPPAPIRSGHVTIPSLSISPPEEDDDAADDQSSDEDETSVTSSDSAVDPTVSPSRRLSDRSSTSSGARVHYGATPLQQQPSATSTANHRRLFGAGVASSSNLLLSSSSAPLAASTRFGFTPAPLLLSSAPTTAAMTRSASPSRFSIASLASFAPSYTSRSILLEEIVPAKLAFLAGFLLGPWCWILGGWWFRPNDGEFTATRARRCRRGTVGGEESCGCGRLVAWGAVAHSVEVKASQEERWGGLDKWVFVNRCATVASGAVVGVLVAVAIWAAVVGA